MVPILLVAFPLLLLVYPRLAWVALAVAIWQLVQKRMHEAKVSARRRVSHAVDSDASI